MAEKDKIMKKSGFKMKGWGGYQSSPEKQQRKTTRGKSGKTYKQRWGELTEEEKKKFGSLEHFEVAGELYHSKKDIEFEEERIKISQKAKDFEKSRRTTGGGGVQWNQ